MGAYVLAQLPNFRWRVDPGGFPDRRHLVANFRKLHRRNFRHMGTGALSAWMSVGIGPAVFTSDVDIDPRSWAPLHTLGASGSTKQKTTARITGRRIKHPPLEVREYNVRTSMNFRESDLLSLSLIQIHL